MIINQEICCFIIDFHPLVFTYFVESFLFILKRSFIPQVTSIGKTSETMRSTYGPLPGFLRGDGDFLGVVTGMLSLVLSLLSFSCCRSLSFLSFSSCSCFFLSLSILCCSNSSSFCFCALANLSFMALLIALLFSWNFQTNLNIRNRPLTHADKFIVWAVEVLHH